MKAEYLSYRIVLFISSLIQNFDTKFRFFAKIFLNVDNSVNIKTRLLKCGVLILDIIMEGTVSQISPLGPSSYYFMLFRILRLQN